MSDVQFDFLEYLARPTPPRVDSTTTALLAHPLWPSLRPYVVVQRTARHTRLELRGLPPDLAARALAMVVPCCACGAAVHPVRQRVAPGARARTSVAGLYLAVTCELHVRMGCARGRAAKDAYSAIRREVGE